MLIWCYIKIRWHFYHFISTEYVTIYDFLKHKADIKFVFHIYRGKPHKQDWLCIWFPGSVYCYLLKQRVYCLSTSTNLHNQSANHILSDEEINCNESTCTKLRIVHFVHVLSLIIYFFIIPKAISNYVLRKWYPSDRERSLWPFICQIFWWTCNELLQVL